MLSSFENRFFKLFFFLLHSNCYDRVEQKTSVQLVQQDESALGDSIARGQTQKLVFCVRVLCMGRECLFNIFALMFHVN